MTLRCAASVMAFVCLAVGAPVWGAGGGERVAGRVVSSVDERPLAHAAVTLIDTGTQQVVAATSADGTGHFSFAEVKPGKYRMMGRANGYLAAAYMAHGQFSTAIVTGAGLATEGLVLRLTPVASISGRVLDESGEVVPRAMVTLYRASPLEADRVTRFRNAMVDDDGAYELTELPAGVYFIAASGLPWYAVHPQNDAQGGSWPYRTSIAAGLDVAYPEMFFPNAADSDGAAPIRIKGGEQVTADFRMTPQPAMTVTLRRPGGETSNGGRMPQLTRTVFGTDEPLPLSMDFQDGVQRITGVPQGRYTVQEFAGTSGLPASSVAVDVTSGSTAVELPSVAAGASLSVRVHGSDAGTAAARTLVQLHAVGSNHVASARVSDKGVAEIAGVPAGTYRPTIAGDGRLMSVAGVAVNGQPAADRLVHVAGEGNVAVELTVSGETTEIDGVATRDGKPDAGSMVLLVPAGGDTSEALFRRDQSDLDGSFVLPNVPPGNYILIAVDDGWEIHWSDVPALTPFLLHGTPVSVPAAGLKTMKLPQPVAAQKR